MGEIFIDILLGIFSATMRRGVRSNETLADISKGRQEVLENIFAMHRNFGAECLLKAERKIPTNRHVRKISSPDHDCEKTLVREGASPVMRHLTRSGIAAAWLENVPRKP
jgi:hypothetical protein